MKFGLFGGSGWFGTKPTSQTSISKGSSPMSVTVKIIKKDGTKEDIKCLYCKARDGFFEVVMTSKPEFKARYFPANDLAEVQTTSHENENSKRPHDDND
jgi:hypothetical protein